MIITFKHTAIALLVACVGMTANADRDHDRGGRGGGGGGGFERHQGGGNNGGGFNRPDRPDRPQRPSFPGNDGNNNGGFHRPDRPQQPGFPQRPQEPQRPFPQQPGQNNGGFHRPDRPQQPGPINHGGNDNHGPVGPINHGGNDNHGQWGHGNPNHGPIANHNPYSPDQRNGFHNQVRQQRQQNAGWYNQRRGQINYQRQEWRNRWHHQSRIDIRIIRSREHWANRYNIWWYNCYRPAPIYINVRWVVPMPDMNTVQYWQVQDIAYNLENLTQQIYDEMAPVVAGNPNQEYAQRLTSVLADLTDASDDYTDAVYDGTFYEDSLYDLFNLDQQLGLAETTLDGYSQAYRVQNEMNALRYYVNELLYIYRMNM